MWERIENVFRLGVKELRGVRADVVLVFLIIYSFTYSVYEPARNSAGELANASVAIVDEDHSEASRRIRDAMRRPFALPAQVISIDEVDRAMDLGRFTFVVNIPPNFERDLMKGRWTPIQFNVDATAMSQVTTGARYIQYVIAQEVAALRGIAQEVAALRAYPGGAPPEVELVVRAEYNANLDDYRFAGIAQIINNITLVAMFLTGAAVIREREHGTLEHLLVLPLGPAEICLSKIWANGLVVMVAAQLSLLIVVQWWLGVPIPGSIPLFMLGQAIYLFAVTSLGIYLATLATSMPQFAPLAMSVFLVLELLSGGATPLESMPEALQTVMQFSPTTHFVTFAPAILFRGAGFDIVWPEFLWVAGIGAVLFTAALLRFRKTLIEAQS
jgi:ABC-2 type transport system permease protein